MSKEELLGINGGGINATLINAVVKLVNMLIELGRTVGSVINRTTKGNYC